ncbi:MAG: molybdate ABC transporter substrate-binding protein, partial [Aureliella sp.]
MRSSFWILLGSVVAAGVLLVLLTRTGVRQSRPWETSTTSASSSESKQPSAEPLLLFCAASNRGPMDAICADYLREFGRSVEIQYGASQTLLSSIEVSHTGDLYLPADASFIDIARDKDLLAETIPLARMHAVVAVSRENPKQISKFEDLLRPDVRLVQANPDAAAIGKLTRELLGKAGLWDKLNEATTAFRTTVTEAANDVVVGAADAAIVYDAVLHTYPTLTAVTLPELKQAESDVVLAVVKSSRQPTAALHFARYASARDRGLKHYAEHGFAAVKGDVWSDQPELSIFAGSMLRPAIEKTITDFEAREGVHVSRVYNGCGILVAQMKAGQHPDAYFACDKEFMNSVPDLFPESVDVSQNQLVILVQKG